MKEKLKQLKKKLPKQDYLLVLNKMQEKLTERRSEIKSQDQSQPSEGKMER